MHISDTLTIDGSKWDKYNFFDSDDLDKSVIGTMAKTAFKVGMMFIPGVGKYYGAMTAAKELGKLFPVLLKVLKASQLEIYQHQDQLRQQLIYKHDFLGLTVVFLTMEDRVFGI